MNEPEPLTLKQPIRLVGLSSAIEKANAPQLIGELWQRAAAAGLLRPDQPAYAAYYDYQDRLANRYRVLVGVESESEPGAGQKALLVPVAAYASFEKEGPAIDAAQSLWRHVWTSWGQRGARRFDIDLERHEGTPAHARVTLLIGVA